MMVPVSLVRTALSPAEDEGRALILLPMSVCVLFLSVMLEKCKSQISLKFSKRTAQLPPTTEKCLDSTQLVPGVRLGKFWS